MIAFLSHWTAWPFVLAGLVALGFLLLAGLGIMHDTGHGIDLDGDGDADIDADAHFWTWFGVGKAPLSVLVMTGLSSFAVTGLLVLAVAYDAWPLLRLPAFPVAFTGALGVAAFSMRGVAGLLARVLPTGDSDALQPGEHTGRVATTISRVTAETGQAKIEGTVDRPVAYVIVAASHPGVVIQPGVDVLLAKYDTTCKLYRVIPTDGLQA